MGHSQANVGDWHFSVAAQAARRARVQYKSHSWHGYDLRVSVCAPSTDRPIY